MNRMRVHSIQLFPEGGGPATPYTLEAVPSATLNELAEEIRHELEARRRIALVAKEVQDGQW